MSADRYEATATGIMVDIKHGDINLDTEKEIKYFNEDTAEPQTVAQAKELILTELGLQVENSRWRIKFSTGQHIDMEETALVKTYNDDLSLCTVVEIFYI